MEQKLIGLSLYSSTPEELKRFLAEVLSLEMEDGPGLFRVQMSELCLDIYHGESPPMKLSWQLSPESYQDLRSRFEFFCFRYAESQPSCEEISGGMRFVTSDGLIWEIFPLEHFTTCENPSVSVRNC